MSPTRRQFLTRSAALAAGAVALPSIASAEPRPVPKYKVVTKFRPSGTLGMPGLYPGRVVTVHSPQCIDEATEQVNIPTVREMIARGMTTLTGDRDPRDSWARFFNAQDYVGIKVNASGAPGAMSMPEVVADVVLNLQAVGVKPENMLIHERGGGQILLAHYERVVP